MRHCNQLTVEQLLSVRDAQPLDATLAQHASECVHCKTELTQLRARRECVAIYLNSSTTLKIAAKHRLRRAVRERWRSLRVWCGVGSVSGDVGVATESTAASFNRAADGPDVVVE